MTVSLRLNILTGLMITRTRVWTILSLFILTFTIAGLIDILMIAGTAFCDSVRSNLAVRLSDRIGTKIRPEPQPYDPYQYLRFVPGLAANEISYKRLHFDLDSRQVIATYDVYLKKDHPIFLMAEQNAAADLANKVLGAVSVSGQLLKFERIETAISDTDDRVHIFVTSAPYQATADTYQISVHAKQLDLPLSIASKEILVHTKGVNVFSGSPFFVPVSKSQENTRYVLPADADEMGFSVRVTDPLPEAEAPPRDTLGAMLQKELKIPGLDNFVFGCLESFPFILLIIWASRYRSEIPHADSLQQVIKTYLIFHFTYFFFYALHFLIEDWRSPFMAVLAYFEQRTLAIFAASNYRKSTYILLPLMAVFLYVWPRFVRSNQDTARSRVSSIVAVILFIGLLGFAGSNVLTKLHTLRTQPGELTVAEFYLVFFSVLAFAIYGLILLLGRFVGHPKPSGFSLTLFLVVILLVAEDLFFIFADGTTNKYLRSVTAILSVLIFAMTAITLTWTFAVLSYQGITTRSLWGDWKGWAPKWRLLLIAGVLAVAVSTRSWSWPMRYWPLWSLAWELKDLFFMLIVWYLGSFLRKASADDSLLKFPDSVRNAGIVLALCLFYSPTTRWNYIPVSFIVGFLLLKYWLLAGTSFNQNLTTEIKSNFRKFVERTIDFNDAQRTLNTLKKELLSQVGKGELEPQEYGEKLGSQNEIVAKYREELMVQDHFAKDYVLALGPGGSAWHNGVRTAVYSILFSLPWSILYLRDLVLTQLPSESYLLLDIFNGILYFVIAWLSYGFIFGYFYPYVRGKNGMQKGAAMFLTIILPELVWTALAQATEANWSSFGFWTLQIFVHTMLLGVIAGDYATLRSNGFIWGHLLDFYRLRSLSAWASSIILAIAAAAGTLLTSGATQILASALKYIGAIPENVDLPKE